MSWVEIEGATKQEAEARALEALAVDDLSLLEIEEVKVVRRFLGMGGKTFKLRARLKVEEGTSEKNIVDMIGEAERARDEANAANLPAAEDRDVQEETFAPVAPTQNTEISEEEKIVVPDGIVTLESIYRPWVAEGAAGIYAPKKGRGYRRRLYATEPMEDDEPVVEERRPAKSAKPKPERAARPAPVEEPGFVDEAEEEIEYDLPAYADDPESVIEEETAQHGVAFVESVIRDMGVDAVVKGYRLADRLLVNIDTDDDNGGLIIGRKGETLEAINYLADIVINRTLENRIRIVVDVERYRDRRKQKIAQQAKKAAEDALRGGISVSLPPMNPAERRVAHITLADDSRVATASEGEGSRRRVVIHPAGMTIKPKKSGGGNRGGGRNSGGRGGNGGGGGGRGRDRSRDRGY